MDEKRPAFNTARAVFGVIFVVSVGLLVLSIVSVSGSTPAATPTPGNGSGPTDKPLPDDNEFGAIGYLSLLTSFISLLGLVSTTLIGWRGERRAARTEELEKRLRELEMEKLRLELKDLKARQDSGSGEDSAGKKETPQ